VYVAGFSAGGRFAYQLGCALSSQITAIAIVGSLQRPYACPLSHPVSELTIMGGDEPVVQGVPASGIPSSATIEQWWRERDGCAGQVQGGFSAPISMQTSGPCVDGSLVSLYIVEGGVHTWPGCSCGFALSNPDAQWDASQGIWAFFAGLHTGSLTNPVAKILTARFVAAGHSQGRVTATFDLGEQVSVKRSLSTDGRTLASRTSLVNPGGQVSVVLSVPRQIKPGSYLLALQITDSYGRKLTVLRKIRVTT
jgi:hypothetical protein